MTVTSGDVAPVGPVVCKYIQTAQEDVERRRLQAETRTTAIGARNCQKGYDERVAELRKLSAHTLIKRYVGSSSNMNRTCRA